ncbi:MAG TPA: class I SAM-dependent methyltransferase [Cryptosporangiaceae bacterium]|nr:class I SAM-dependent methyltransferase [Cryptosporangiaceae bacterium]
MPGYHDAASLRGYHYRDGSHLDARVRLHRDFTTASVPWYRWVFDQLVAHTPDVAAVLEVGAGTGTLWTTNLDRLPMAWWVWLTDLSPGMVAEMCAAVDGVPQLIVAEADAADLPLGEHAFDTVVANHVLHHVSDPCAVLAELARVLRPGGRLLAATNGHRHLTELFSLLNRLPDARRPPFTLSFHLDNGADLLAGRFCDVRMERFADELRVTDAEAVVAYLRSTAGGDGLTDEQVTQIRAEVDAAIVREGAFRVTKDVALFVATAR